MVSPSGLKLARTLCAVLLVSFSSFAAHAQSGTIGQNAVENGAPIIEAGRIPLTRILYFRHAEDRIPFKFELPTIDIVPAAAQNKPATDDTADEKQGSAVPSRLARSKGPWVIPDGSTEWGVELGIAGDIATWMSGPKYYDIENRGHIAGSFRWGRILGTRGQVTYSWAIEVLPINIALGNEVDNPRYIAGAPAGEPRRNREATWGVGINPASFRFIFFPRYRLRPQIGSGFGIVRHYKRVPTVEGTKMNFQFDFQVGGQYMLKENKALNFGYRYYHLSNLYLFNFNPGYNVNMWFVGYSVFK
ncbi:MAG: acyloxyacyl hydrolase [Acidobacteriota bacterium]